MKPRLLCWVATLLVLGRPAPGEAQGNTRFEAFGLAGLSGLSAPMTSSYGPYDFGSKLSRTGADLGGGFVFRLTPKLGLEIEAVRLWAHRADIREDLGADIIDVERRYSGLAVSGGVMFPLFRLETGGAEVEPYLTGGPSFFRLRSQTIDTRLDPPGGYCPSLIGCAFPTVNARRNLDSTASELGFNAGFGVRAYPRRAFSVRPEYRFFASPTVRIHRVSFGFGVHW